MESPLILNPTMVEIPRLQPFIAQVTEEAGILDKEAKRLRLAVEEAVVNVINYGGATAITLTASVEPDQLVLTIDDDGLPFDPTQDSPSNLSAPADERPPGGLGIFLMRQMTDSLTYQRINGHNILRMGKKI